MWFYPALHLARGSPVFSTSFSTFTLVFDFFFQLCLCWCICVCPSCTWRGIWHSTSPALFSRIFSSLSNDFFPLHYLSFSLLLGQVLAFCFVLALLVKLELEREMKFKSSYLGAYNIAALITDQVQKKFYGLLIRFTEIILGFHSILLCALPILTDYWKFCCCFFKWKQVGYVQTYSQMTKCRALCSEASWSKNTKKLSTRG